MRTHPNIELMIARQQACSRLAAPCAFLVVYCVVFITDILHPEIRKLFHIRYCGLSPLRTLNNSPQGVRYD